MSIPTVSFWTQMCRIACAAASVVVLCATIRAGEKIQIIEGTDKPEFPNQAYHPDFLSEPFNPLKRGSSGTGSLMPIMPPPSQRPIRPEKPEEKNWLNPQNFDRDAALKQIFKIREYNLDSDKKQTPALERAFGNKSDTDKPTASRSPQDRNADSGRERAEQTGADQDRFGTRRNEMRPDPWAPSTAETDRSGLLLPNQSGSSLLGGVLPGQNRDLFNPANGAKLGNIFDRSTDLQSQRPKEQVSKSDDFERLLGRKPPSDALADAINFQTDKTRQEINPVTGRRLDSLTLSPSAITGTLNPAANPGLDTRRPPLTPFDSKVLGVSSLAPAVVIPAPSTPGLQPKPPVLEIPKRKF